MQEVYTADAALAADTAPYAARLGVVGNPIAHSRSPQMQLAALRAAGIPGTYVRVLAEREGDAFERTIAALQRMGFCGLNVTVPFKYRAYAAADCSGDPLASLCGSCNTLAWRNQWVGWNTDGPGFARAIREWCGQELSELRIVLLGACGGAGSALACECALAGCKHLTLVNRPKPALQELEQKLSPYAPVQAVAVGEDDARRAAVQQADLVVNATSLGLNEGDELPLPADWLTPRQWVYDIVTHHTPFQAAARERGCQAADGSAMLLWQGAYAFEKWFGTMPDTGAMRAALEDCQRADDTDGH
ncbi:MAG: shikimate dehydrogenase [Akkermansia sp.]|nr:shikimate dehydrogenase [Akkermansia sp.]